MYDFSQPCAHSVFNIMNKVLFSSLCSGHDWCYRVIYFMLKDNTKYTVI